MRVFVSEDLRG